MSYSIPQCIVLKAWLILLPCGLLYIEKHTAYYWIVMQNSQRLGQCCCYTIHRLFLYKLTLWYPQIHLAVSVRSVLDRLVVIVCWFWQSIFIGHLSISFIFRKYSGWPLTVGARGNLCPYAYAFSSFSHTDFFLGLWLFPLFLSTLSLITRSVATKRD